ncbi:YbaB/EbfC family nucleoid-associated protein [Nonomuraea zeae]|uniref:YbaB/EbfC family nucleoid-associated protein n=1 Tax=Nonomuraea zeae TaxID=1642303 RepID=A0A5S4GJE1_9ACTN|nr:YbaB/EbfC family nucleoid-associated protein [Nonomuraea zeae]TMR33068.1 YbaB/EbfC family nucleoid-associated protein [Nonomuraea zeae]
MDFTQALGFDPERLAADADRFFDQLGRPPGAPATARAESKDGWVSVEYDCASGVRDLRLDPRAMRMDSARLAETILGLIHQARQQAETEERGRAESLLGAGNALLDDRRLAAARLRDATGTLQENLERAGATIDRVRALLRERTRP